MCEQSKEWSGPRLKTESVTGERREKCEGELGRVSRLWPDGASRFDKPILRKNPDCFTVQPLMNKIDVQQ